jgi:hypothetical protein
MRSLQFHVWCAQQQQIRVIPLHRVPADLPLTTGFEILDTSCRGVLGPACFFSRLIEIPGGRGRYQVDRALRAWLCLLEGNFAQGTSKTLGKGRGKQDDRLMEQILI